VGGEGVQGVITPRCLHYEIRKSLIRRVGAKREEEVTVGFLGAGEKGGGGRSRLSRQGQRLPGRLPSEMGVKS